MSQDKIDSVVDLQSTGSELDKLFNQLQSVFALIKQINQEGAKINLSRGISDAVIAAQEAKAATELLRQEREKLRLQEDALRVAVSAGRVEQQAANTEAAQARAALAALNLERQRSRQAVVNEAGSLNDLRAKLTLARREYDALGASARNASTGRNLQAVITQINQQVTQIEQSTGRFQRNVGNYPTEILGGTAGLLSTFGIATGGAEIAKKIFDTTREISSLNQGLETVSKTEREFSINQDFLSGTADKLGLNVMDLTNAFKLFYASSTTAGLSADQTRKIFDQVSGASANLHLSQDNTNGVLLAFSQILSKGKVASEELRKQIGERVPGAFTIAADSIGVTTQQLDKMLKQGKLTATDFIPKFAAALSQAFGPENGERVESLNASINRLSNTFTGIVGENESGLSKFFTSFIDGMQGSLIGVNKLIEGLSSLTQSFAQTTVGKGVLAVLDPLDVLGTKDSNVLQVAAKKNKDDLKTFLQDLSEKSKEEQQQVITQYQKVAADLLSETAKLRKKAADLNTTKALFDPASIAASAGINQQLAALQSGYVKAQDYADAAQKQLLGTDKDTTTALTKEEQARQARLAELRIKANADVAKADLDQQIEDEKRILENDQIGYTARLEANDKYLSLKEQLNKLETDAQKKEIQQQIAIGKAVPEQLAAVDAKANAATFKNQTEYAANFVKITKDTASAKVKALTDGYETEQQNLIKAQDEETAKVQQYYNEGKINTEQFEAEKLRIKNKYDILNLQAELDTQLQILDLMKQQGADTAQEENKILSIKNQLRALDLQNTENIEDAKTKAQQKAAKDRADVAKQELDMSKQLAKESLNAVFAIFDAQYDAQKQQLQDQIDGIDKTSQKEIDAINASTDSEQDKADKIAVINARSQAQKDQLAQRQKQVDEQKARFDRLKSIADIVSGTAVNIVKAGFNPILIALAVAIGAAQLAQVLATPIPKYRTGAGVNGRPEHPGGLAYVNDGGKLEVVEPPNGPAYIPQGENVLLNMQKGTKVHASVEDYVKNTGMYHKKLPTMSVTAHTLHMSAELGKQYEKHTKVLKESIDKGMTHVHVHNTYAGLMTSRKKANSYQQFLDREIFF